ncbi:NADase-type glycan-binding domain-containing protein [Micromonospora sp. NPDC003197]
MIVCAECGTSNRDDERFCGECGAFLEWDGAVAERTAPVPAPQTKQQAETTTAPAPSSSPDDSPETKPSDPVERPTVVERTTDPVAVQPGQVQTRRPVRPVEEPRSAVAAGDRVCPRCQAGNEELRRFCRACGAPLVETEVAARLPWWRRLLNRLRQRSREARSRRDRRATANAKRLLKIVAVICVLVILAIVGPPLVSRAISEVRDLTQPHVPLTPATVTASSAGNATPASRIADGAHNRYWAPTGPAVDSWVEVTFARPVRVLDILVTPGINVDQAKFLTVGRPDQLEVSATTSDGKVIGETLKLRDQPGAQTFKFEASGVVRLRIVVRSTYGPQSEPSVAIAEVEFFGRT